MERVTCEVCGKTVPKEKSVCMFELAGSHATVMCLNCYYKELVKSQKKGES